MGQVQTEHSRLEPLRHRWAALSWVALSAVALTACGFFGGDEPGAPSPDGAGGEPSADEASEDAEPEQKSVIEAPRLIDAQEPSDEGSDPGRGRDSVDAGEPPDETGVTEDEPDGAEECWWETEDGADVFGGYMMASVVCTILAPESSDSDEPSDAPSLLPDGALLGGEARFGWRCTVGEQGDSSDDQYYVFDHEGRLEVFASNGGSPQTLQFEQVQLTGQPSDAGPAREAAVLVRFGSDYHPFKPSSEVVVAGADLDDPDLVPAVENQEIAYNGLWRNSESRPPRDRAGVLSVLEDRNYGGRYDPDEFEASQEHSRHDEFLLYAPDDMVDPITAALLRDISGRLYTAIAGIYIDFDISGWEEHVGPVLDLCFFRDVPLPLPPEPADSEDEGEPADSEDASELADSEEGELADSEDDSG